VKHIANSVNLVDFIILGAMKAGTTSLYSMLNSHPSFCMSNTKETNFFLPFGRLGSKSHLGPEWYKKQFLKGIGLKGEASTNYTKLPRSNGTAENIMALAPKAKLIYVVRDPVRRSISHYFHNVIQGTELRPIVQAFSSHKCLYISTSLYYYQLTPYIELFPRDQVYVMVYERFWSEPRVNFEHLLNYLSVDLEQSPRYTYSRKNLTAARIEAMLSSHSRTPIQESICAFIRENGMSTSIDIEKISEFLGFTAALRREMASHFYDDILMLRKYLGGDLSEWDGVYGGQR
jgi:hypothetical protein